VKAQVDFWSTGLRGDIVQLPLVKAVAQSNHIEQRIVFSDAGPSRVGFEETGLPFVATPGNRRVLNAPTTLARIMQCRARLRDWYAHHKPIVHVTMASAWDQFYLDVPKRNGAKILLTIHDAVQHIGEESRIMIALENRLIRLADDVVVLSNYAGERMVERIDGLRPVHVVSPGLVMDTRTPSPPKNAPRDRPIKFLFFGRIRDYKGLDFTLDAWARIKSNSNLPMHLTIAGSGEIDKYSAAIKRLPDVDLIHGWMSDENMDQIFAEHDVNLLPYREGSSSATSLAGMWAGMPTIASPIGGFKEQLIPDVNALIMNDISAESLAICMLRLAASPELYDQLAKGAHVQAHALSAPIVAENWRNLYERIWGSVR
jgi:glycosyltransferase involved in cell wall biosynthesis